VKQTWLNLAAIFLLATTAAASQIDFRNIADFGGAKDQLSFSIAHSSGFNLDFDPGPAGATLWWDKNDGFGVQYAYEGDEVEGDEWLRLDFSPNVILVEIHFTDLFNELGYLETGSFEINGSGTWTPFSALEDQQWGNSNGELFFPVNQQVDFITFMAPGWDNGQHHEYAVAGVEVTQIPVPGAVWLLGSGLIGVIFLRRKRLVK